jgi:glycerate dehydrogenase
MRIVVLDGYTANPGDLSWEELEKLGKCEIHDRTAGTQVVERAQDAEILLTNKTVINRATIAALPKLRYIGVLATGFNIVDIEAAKERGIPVCNVPEYGTPNVAQAVFALLLELTNRTGHHSDTVHAGRWSASQDFCYWDGSLIELHGLTLGLVGFGRIAQATVQIARGFGMKILASRRRPSTPPTPAKAEGSEGVPKNGPMLDKPRQIAEEFRIMLDKPRKTAEEFRVNLQKLIDEYGRTEGVEFVDLDRLFSESDIISLHCPLTPETKEMVNATRLAQMKPSAFLINTARGALVNEKDLADALNRGRIAGAGLDVLSMEPPPAGNPLLSAKNCVITPHIAWATRNARARLLDVAVENIRGWIDGQPQNVVNPDACFPTHRSE